MGIINPSKEEEEALKLAQKEQSSSNVQRYNSFHSLSESQYTSTDYESAKSCIAGGKDNYRASETEYVNPEDTNTADIDDVESLKTIQQSVDISQLKPETSDSHVVNKVDSLTNIASLKSHKSFDNRNSPYGPPITEQANSEPQIGSDAFHLALQRTISRKSVTRKSLINQEKAALAAEPGKEDEGIDSSNLDWDSANDKDNPKNWPNTKKWLATMSTAMICLVVTFGSSLFVCGIPDIILEMHVSQELAVSGLSLYLLGLAFGPVIAAPLSELFGRRIVYITSLPISILFTMGVGLANNIRTILVLRFFSGFTASPAMAVAGGTIADIWDFEMMGIAMGGFCLAPFMGPVLGPVIGGFVAEKKGWKWTLWVHLMFSGIVFVPVLLTPETYKPAILKARAKKRGIKLAKPPVSIGEFIKVILFVTLVTPIKMLFVEPIVMVFSIYIAFVFAVLFGFFEAYPLIFRGVYRMEIGISGLCFLGILVGFVLGTALYAYFDRYVWFKKNPDGTRGKRDSEGKLIFDPPESRLILCKIGGVSLPPALFWIGWSARKSVHWISPVIAGVPFGFGLVLIFFCTITYFSMSYPPLSLASALAANNLFRYILASAFPLFTIQMYNKLGIDWASSTFAFIALALTPVPWILEKWGPELRQTSTYGYTAMIKKAQKEAETLAALQDETEKEVFETQKGSTLSTSTDEADHNNV